MPSATNTVTINRSPDEVFAFVADGTTATRWRPGVLDVAHVSGDGVGARYRQGVRGHGDRRIAGDYEVTAYERGRRLAYRTVAGLVRPTGEYLLEPLADGTTRLTFSLTAELGFVQRLLFGGFAQRALDGDVDALDRLRQHLEA